MTPEEHRRAEAAESAELRLKELVDAKKKATTRGLPYCIYRGFVYRIDGSESPRQASMVEQIFWDALSVLG